MPEITLDNIFLQSVLEQVPRLLGQLNRNPLSKSYGSFDKAYWHYRINDISCARYQEAVLVLALLYNNQFRGNIYYQDKKILAWINACLDYTCLLQNKDGSFNEWYVNEKSFGCTAFIVLALSEVLLILSKNKINNFEKILKVVEKSASWLSVNREELILNQTAGSVPALFNVFLLTDKVFYKGEADKKISFILNNQTKEGWWSEYGGPDIGYLSLTINYLAKYYKYSKDDKALEAIKKAAEFITYFLHPNLTTGGEYMARNTEFLIPNGLVGLSQADEKINFLAKFAALFLEARKGVILAKLDDRYLCYFLSNWLEAGLAFNNGDYKETIEDYLTNRSFNKFFEQAGIRVLQNKAYYLVINLYKGGVFRIYTRWGNYIDAGLEIKFKGGSYITNVLDYNTIIENNENFIKITTSLKKLNELSPHTLQTISFKTFQLLFGRAGLISRIIKRKLREKMINGVNKTRFIIKRSFIIKDDRIEVIDCINQPLEQKNISWGVKSSYNFIPSAKYFTTQELSINHLEPTVEKFSLNKESTIIKRIFNFH